MKSGTVVRSHKWVLNNQRVLNKSRTKSSRSLVEFELVWKNENASDSYKESHSLIRAEMGKTRNHAIQNHLTEIPK